MTQPRFARTTWIAGLLLLVGACLWQAWADGPEPDPDPVGAWRAETVALSEAEVEQRFAAADDPVKKAAHAVMLAERLARRAYRESVDRIAELFAQADAALAGRPADRVEAALLGARLLLLDARHAEPAVARLRGALAAADLPRPTRSRAEYGLAFLTPDLDEAARLCARVVADDPDGAYAPLAAIEGIRFAVSRPHAADAIGLALRLQSLPRASAEDRVEGLRRVAREALARTGVFEYGRGLPGLARHRIPSADSTEPGAGVLLALSPPGALDQDTFEHPSLEELAAPRLLTSWTAAPSADLLAPLAPGRYLAVFAEGGGIWAHLYDLTALALESRVAPDELILRACDARDGSPAAGARVHGEVKIDPSAEPAGKTVRIDAVADAQGIVRVPLGLPSNEETTFRLSVNAIHALGTAWLDEGDSFYGGTPDGWRAVVYTAKPLVRPGEEVAYRVAVRQRVHPEQPAVPAGKRFSVSFWHGGEVFATQTVTLSEFGTAGGTLRVRPDAQSGMVYARVLPVEAGLAMDDPDAGMWDDPERGEAAFRVEEYRLAEVLVEVEPDRAAYVTGSVATLAIRARGAEGGPVPGYAGRISLRAFGEAWWEVDEMATLPFVPGKDARTEEDESPWLDTELAVPAEQLEFVTDATGNAAVRFALPDPGRYPLMRVYVTAEGQDPRGRMAEGRASFRLGREAGRVVVAVEYDWRGAAVVRGRAHVEDLEGKRQAVPIRLALQRWEGYGRGWVETTARVLDTGESAFEFTGVPGGTYRVRASAELEGGAVAGEDWAWIWNGASGTAGALRADSLRLIAERLVYRPGETLVVDAIVPDGVKAVFACLEADEIHDARVVAVEGGRARLEFPLTAATSPNVRVAASVWQGGKRRTGSLERFVDTGSLGLTVEVAAEPAEARPGQEASWTVRVRDAEGRPVDGEVSLAIVDERVYGIQEDPTPGLLRRFAPRPRRYLACGYASEFELDGEEAGSGRGSAGATACFSAGEDEGGGGGPLGPVTVRRDFRDLAGWFDAVRTGPDGEATVRASFSGSLTPWRATARAFGTAGGAGEARGAARTSLPMSVRLDLPRILRARDSVRVAAVVRNLTAEPLSGSVTLSVEGLTTKEALEQRVQVEPGGTAEAVWRLEAGTAAQAVLRAVARLGGHVDAVERRIELVPVGTRTGISARAVTDAQGRAQLLLAAVRDPDRASIDVTVASEELERVLEPVESLLHYPYGCVEQTMSGFMPAVIVQASLARLGVRWPSLEARLPGITQAGLRRLMGFQHADGGWGWWTGDETHPFMTAYVLHGLRLARANGTEVDASVLERGLDCAAGLLATTDDPATHHYLIAALVEAGRELPEGPPRVEPGVSSVALAFAARSAAKSGRKDESARWLGRLISEARRVPEGGAHWEESSGMWRLPGAATAVAVEALVALGGPRDLVTAGLLDLDLSRGGPRGFSTVENAFAVLAAASHLEADGLRAGPIAAELRVGDSVVAPRADASGDRFRMWTIAGREALAGPLNLLVTGPADRPLRVTVRGIDYRPDDDLPPPTGGMRVERTLLRLAAPDAPDEDDSWVPVAAGEPVQVGVPYRIAYRVECPKEVEYLALADPRPAGLEPVSPRSGPVESRQGSDVYLDLGEREIALFHAAPYGRFEVRLPVRFDVQGTVRWAPARAWTMYDEGVQAFTEGRTLTILPPGPVTVRRETLERFEEARAREDVSGMEAESAVWRRLPLDLTDAERAHAREIAMSCRAHATQWEWTKNDITAGVVRMTRPHSIEDLEFLLQLAGPDPGEWPEALSDSPIWRSEQDLLVQLAVGRGSATAWAALYRLERMSAEPMLGAVEALADGRRVEMLDPFAHWIAHGFAQAPQVFWDQDPRPELTAEGCLRVRALLGEWLGAIEAGTVKPDATVWRVYAWSESMLEAAATDGAARDPGWEAFRLRALEAAMRTSLEVWQELDFLGSRLGHPEFHARWARRAVEQDDPEVWDLVLNGFQARRRSPEPFLHALDGKPGDAGRAASDVFFAKWFEGDPYDPAGWDLPAAERDAALVRFGERLAGWFARHEEIGPTMLCALAWLERTGRAGPAADATRIPALESVLARMKGVVLRARPSNPDVLEALAAAGHRVQDSATLREWVRRDLVEVAAHAPALGLACLSAALESPSPRGVQQALAEVPPSVRAAVGATALAQSGKEGPVAWLRFLLADADASVREVAEDFLIQTLDASYLDWHNPNAREHYVYMPRSFASPCFALLEARPEAIFRRLKRERHDEDLARTIAVAAAFDLEEAVPILAELWRTDPEFLSKHREELAGFRCPAAHELLCSVHARKLDDVHEDADRAMLWAIECTAPVADADGLMARVKQAMPARDVEALGRWTGATIVQEVLRRMAAVHPQSPLSAQACAALLRGAARRRDAVYREAWRDALAAPDGLREHAVVGLAWDPSPEARAILVGWLTSEGGRRFLEGVCPVPAAVANPDWARRAWMRPEELQPMRLDETLPVPDGAEALPNALQVCVERMSPAETARLLRGVDAGRFPGLVSAWIYHRARLQDESPEVLGAAAEIAARLLGANPVEGEAAERAMRWLADVPWEPLSAALATVSDEAFVACASRVIREQDAAARARLVRIACGPNASLARHAAWALAWADRRGREEPGLPRPWIGLVGPEAPANPYAAESGFASGDALRATLGEEPFATARGRKEPGK